MHTPSPTTSPKATGASFVGMARDGSKVFFTSDEQLTTDDTDTSIDLFMWEEASELSHASRQGIGEVGNTDACSAGWVERCGVQTIDATIDTVPKPPKKNLHAGQLDLARPAKSTSTRPSSSTAARASPTSGTSTSTANGAPQFVATLSGSPGGPDAGRA